jgi:tetratricopeptide (TPR) repeat protein
MNETPAARTDKRAWRKPLALVLGCMLVALAGAAAVWWHRHEIQDARRAAEHEKEAHLRDVLVKLALAYKMQGQLYNSLDQVDSAEQAYLQARETFADLAQRQPEVPNHAAEVALTYVFLGDLCMRRGRPEEAEKAYREALDRFHKLTASNPDNTDYRQVCARLHSSLGMVWRGAGRLADAEGAYREALALFEELRRQHPTVAEAEAAHREALAVFEQLVRDFPDDALQQEALAYTHADLGNLNFLQGRLKEAEAAYEKARPLFERLAHDFPKGSPYRLALGGTYAGLGNALSRARKSAEALVWYAKAFPILEELLRQEGQPVEARYYLAHARRGRAEAHGQQGHHAEALKDWEEALVLDDGSCRQEMRAGRATTLARMDDHAQAVEEAKALSGQTPRTPRVLFGLACAYAAAAGAAGHDGKLSTAERDRLAAEYAARAVELLSKADKAGLFQDPGTIEDLKQESALDPLRSRDDFRKLLASIEEKTRRKPPSAPR